MERTRASSYRILQAGVANYFESSGRFKYKRISVYDASTSDLVSHSGTIVSYIATALIHGSILVHCQHGASRSPTCVAFYLMSRQGMTLEEAMTLLKTKRPAVEPIPAFQKQLQDYEKLCVESGSIVKSGVKRKQDDEGGTSMKRKVVSAPIGPAFQSTKAAGSFNVPSERIAIGPMLPPSHGKVAVSSPEAIVVNGPSEKGPSMVSAARGTVAQSSPAQKQTLSGTRTIGPTMPPTTN